MFLDVQASSVLLSRPSVQMLEVPNVLWAQRLHLQPWLRSVCTRTSSFFCSEGRGSLASVWLQFVRESLPGPGRLETPPGILPSFPPPSTLSCLKMSRTLCFLPRSVNTPPAAACSHSTVNCLNAEGPFPRTARLLPTSLPSELKNYSPNSPPFPLRLSPYVPYAMTSIHTIPKVKIFCC